MSLKIVIKKALKTLNRQLQESENYKHHLLENSLRILNQKHVSVDAPNRYGIFERSAAFAFMLTQTPNRLRFFLNLSSRALVVHSAKLDKGAEIVKKCMGILLIGSIGFVGFKTYEAYLQYQAKIEENENYVMQQSVSWLGRIINQTVYQNSGIQNSLTNLIQGLCARQSILHNTVKGLNRVYDIGDVRRNTPVLLKQVLRNNVYYEDEITRKLKSVTITQLRSPLIRGLLVDALVQFGNSDTCKELVSSNFANALQNEGVKQTIRQTGFSTFHSYLDDSKMKELVVQKIRAQIGPNPSS